MLINVSGEAKPFKKEERRGEIMARLTERLAELQRTVKMQYCYLPTNPEFHIKEVVVDSAAAMQSAGKAPYRLMFRVERWDGPDSALREMERKPRVGSVGFEEESHVQHASGHASARRSAKAALKDFYSP